MERKPAPAGRRLPRRRSTLLPSLHQPRFSQLVRQLGAEARRIADQLGGPVTALLAGNGVSGTAASLGGYGVDKVLVAESDQALPSPEWVLAAAEQAAKQIAPQAVLLSHSTAGRELGPGLAFRLGTGVVTDCTSIAVENGQLVIT